MTDRTVRVILKASTGQYQAAMAAAGLSTEAVAAKIQSTSKTSKTDMGKMGVAGGVAGAALFGGFMLATKATMGFDKQLSQLGAVSNTSAGEMEKLRQAALDAGRATVFSATEAAEAETELSKAGISTADILGGALTGSLALAAAGGLDLAESATIAAQSMNIFKLKGSDVGHVADLLAAGANKSAADVHGLGESLRMGGLVAAQTGLTIEETTGAFAAFADNALIGSDAGTSLKTMLLNLNPKSAKAGELMYDLGLSAYDATGEFIGLSEYAGVLQNALKGMSTEQRMATLHTLFGTDAIRAANILYTEGAEGMQKYEDSVNDTGAATRMAAEMTNNLSGDLERLGGSFQTALIGKGEESTSSLREMTQSLTQLVDGFNSMPQSVDTAMGQLGKTMLATFGMGGFGGLSHDFQDDLGEIDAALAGMVGSGSAAQAAMAMGELEKKAADAGMSVEELKAELPGYQAALQGVADETKAGADATEMYAEQQEDAEQEVKDMSDALREQIDLLAAAKLGEMDLVEARIEFRKATRDAADKLKVYNKAVRDHGKDSKEAKAAQADYNQSMRDAKRDLFNVAKQAGDTAEKQALLAGSTESAADGAAAYKEELVRLRNGMSPGSPLRRYLQGLIDKLDEAARDRTGTLIYRFSSTQKAAIRKSEAAQGHAFGGWVGGSGGSTADDVPIMASSGEYVVRASQARRHGALLEAVNSGATLSAAGGRGGSSVMFAPTFQIDAQGSRLSRQEIEDVATEVVNESWRQFAHQRGAA